VGLVPCFTLVLVLYSKPKTPPCLTWWWVGVLLGEQTSILPVGPPSFFFFFSPIFFCTGKSLGFPPEQPQGCPYPGLIYFCFPPFGEKKVKFPKPWKPTPKGWIASRFWYHFLGGTVTLPIFWGSFFFCREPPPILPHPNLFSLGLCLHILIFFFFVVVSLLPFFFICCTSLVYPLSRIPGGVWGAIFLFLFFWVGFGFRLLHFFILPCVPVLIPFGAL